MTNPMSDERRMHPRISTNVRCWLERKSVTLYGSVTNLSSTGLFLCTPVTVSVGQDVSLSLDLGNGVVEAQGHVVWAKPGPCESGQPGIGIAIDRIEQGEAVLSRFIDERTE